MLKLVYVVGSGWYSHRLRIDIVRHSVLGTICWLRLFTAVGWLPIHSLGRTGGKPILLPGMAKMAGCRDLAKGAENDSFEQVLHSALRVRKRGETLQREEHSFVDPYIVGLVPLDSDTRTC